MLQVITRKHASDVGLSRYYTGVACGKGHLAERYTTSGNCCICSSESSKQFGRNLRASRLGLVPFKVMLPLEIIEDVRLLVETMIAAHNLVNPPGVKAAPPHLRSTP